MNWGCNGNRNFKILSQVKHVKNPASRLSARPLLQESLKFQLEYVVHLQTTYAAENRDSPNCRMIRKTPCGKPSCSTLKTFIDLPTNYIPMQSEHNSYSDAI